TPRGGSLPRRTPGSGRTPVRAAAARTPSAEWRTGWSPARKPASAGQASSGDSVGGRRPCQYGGALSAGGSSGPCSAAAGRAVGGLGFGFGLGLGGAAAGGGAIVTVTLGGFAP